VKFCGTHELAARVQTEQLLHRELGFIQVITFGKEVVGLIHGHDLAGGLGLGKLVFKGQDFTRNFDQTFV
jgi:hypothetical protein